MPEGRHSAPRDPSDRSDEARQRAIANEQRLKALGEAVDKVRAKYGFRSLKLAGGALTDRRLAHPSPGLAFQPPDA